MSIIYEAIGTIMTPYDEIAPFRPDPQASGEFSVILEPAFTDALLDVDRFSHIIVIFHFNRALKTNLRVHPPHLKGKETGLFASRSPNRINKIGINIVKVLRTEGNVIFTSSMDILNNTPLLDIKPYIPATDCHPEANSGHLSPIDPA